MRLFSLVYTMSVAVSIRFARGSPLLNIVLFKRMHQTLQYSLWQSWQTSPLNTLSSMYLQHTNVWQHEGTLRILMCQIPQHTVIPHCECCDKQVQSKLQCLWVNQWIWKDQENKLYLNDSLMLISIIICLFILFMTFWVWDHFELIKRYLFLFLPIFERSFIFGKKSI